MNTPLLWKLQSILNTYELHPRRLLWNLDYTYYLD